MRYAPFEVPKPNRCGEMWKKNVIRGNSRRFEHSCSCIATSEMNRSRKTPELRLDCVIYFPIKSNWFIHFQIWFSKGKMFIELIFHDWRDYRLCESSSVWLIWNRRFQCNFNSHSSNQIDSVVQFGWRNCVNREISASVLHKENREKKPIVDRYIYV